MKTYPKMKDSGVEWIGKIPEKWEMKKIKSITKCLDGRRIPLNGVERSSMSGNIPYYGASGIVDHINDYIFDEKLICLSEDGDNLRSRVLPIAFTIEGKSWVNNHAHVLRPTQINENFLVYLLNSLDLIPYLEGATRVKLNQSTMNSIPLPYPPSNEQKQIVKFLDKETVEIDSKIEKNLKILGFLKEKRKAVIKQAITKGLDPTVSLKDSEVKWIGNTPELWKIAQLRFFGKFVSGTGFPHEDQGKIFGDYPFFKVADTNEKDNEIYMNNSENWISEEIRIKLKAKIAPKNSILFPKIGAVLLKNKRRILTTESIFDNNMMAFYPYSKQFKFWYYLFLLIDFKEIVNPGPVPSLSDDKLKEFRIIVPSETEQKIILDFLDIETTKIDLLMINLKNIIEKLQKYCQALISSTVTGKIDVREAVA